MIYVKRTLTKSWTVTSQPAWIRASTSSKFPAAAAKWSGVCPSPSRTEGAPRFNNSMTRSDYKRTNIKFKFLTMNFLIYIIALFNIKPLFTFNSYLTFFHCNTQFLWQRIDFCTTIHIWSHGDIRIWWRTICTGRYGSYRNWRTGSKGIVFWVMMNPSWGLMHDLWCLMITTFLKLLKVSKCYIGLYVKY